MSKTRTIYPVPGYFIIGVPTTVQSLPADEAEALVATGAFTYEETPGQPAETPETSGEET